MNIELRHIHKTFGPVHANNDINVTFAGGRIMGILGENGAGKSTLMKILSGYQRADSGEIWIDGQPTNYRNPQEAIAHGIGMLQQDPLDVPAFSVLENFTFGLPIKRSEARLKLVDISARFGFSLDPDRPIAHLTIAQRQQLEIIRLLALGVKTLILDEPTTGISAEQKNVLFMALKALARDDGMTILLVSHKLEDVRSLCDEVVTLRGGRRVGDTKMPTSTGEMVRLMFGQELAPQTREQVMLGEPVLTVEELELRAGRLHVEHLSVKVRAGEVVGLAGLDGSGQELVMRLMAGLIHPIRGKIIVNGQDMTRKAYRQFKAHGIAFSAAGRLEEGLIAGLTLTEHVALVNENGLLLDWERARKHTETQIAHYNVRGRATDPIERLSGGNQQRVLMALMPAKPVAMVLEQPTRGLDVDSARWIWEQLLARRAGGTAIIFSSAELDELVAYSDRILVFYAGRVYEVTDPQSINIDRLGHLIGGEFEEIAADTL